MTDSADPVVVKKTPGERIHGRAEKLHEYIASCAAREFAYGAFDCCLFCADWALIATGTDYAAELRGYKTCAQAYELIAGFGSIEAMVTKLLGKEPIHPAFAQQGDIVLGSFPTVDGDAEGLGICLGVFSAFPVAKGLVHHRTLKTRLAWRI